WACRPGSAGVDLAWVGPVMAAGFAPDRGRRQAAVGGADGLIPQVEFRRGRTCGHGLGLDFPRGWARVGGSGGGWARGVWGTGRLGATGSGRVKPRSLVAEMPVPFENFGSGYVTCSYSLNPGSSPV